MVVVMSAVVGNVHVFVVDLLSEFVSTGKAVS